MGTRSTREGEAAIEEFVAIRKFKEHKNSREREVTLTISKPQCVRPSEWSCAFEVMGLKGADVVRQTVYGVDGLQALVLAIEACRIALAKHEKHLSWIGADRGDCGLPRQIPDILGKAFGRRLGRIIDNEFKHRLAALKRRHRKGASAKGQRRRSRED